MNNGSQHPEERGGNTEPQAKPRLSPRHRRLRRTLAGLAIGITLVVTAAVWALLRHRPEQYRPDEANAEITSSLVQGLPPEAPKPRWTDVTRAAGLDSFRTFRGDRTSQLPEDMGSGAAWGDFDNDGDDDLFLVSAGGNFNLSPDQLLPSELDENLGNGTFRKVAGFPETRLHGMGAAWGDYDGDGYLDLMVTGYNTLRLFHNERGSGRFVRDARFPDLKGFWSSATWGDFDNDRQLDLYVCGYVQYSESESDRNRGSDQLGTFVPYTLNPASYKPALNLLFHNKGDGTFTEMAEKLGVANPTGRSLGALWHDFDNDGWLDLYIANDISDNAFYRNKGGTFEDISHSAWVADYRSAMGLAAGDYNRDGDDDLFVVHWVAQENALYDNLFADYNANPALAASRTNANATSPPAAGSKYPLRFMDVADQKGLGQIALQFIGWGTEFVDFDADGWLDLIVANGSTLEIDGPLPRKLKPQEAFLFWNRRSEFFHNLAPLSPPLAQPHVSRGLAVSDYDNDGDMDVVMVQLGEGVQLLRNDMQTGHWLKVRLRSKQKNGTPNGFGDGSTVIAHVGGVGLRRTVSSVSYLSQSSHVLHFGLGAARQVERLEVRWLGGETNIFANLEGNSTYEILEGDPTPRRKEPIGKPESVPPVAGPSSLSSTRESPTGTTTPVAGEKARLVEFWNRQRAAMNAMKVDQDIPKAIALFRQALALDPKHEDSHYYLGHCLAMQGDWAEALKEMAELVRMNPQSHRGHQQWGTLRALSAKSDADLAAAEKSLDAAHHLNPEETGALLVLGEIALLRGEPVKADERLAAACRTNPRAVGGFFLRGYVAWQKGETATATEWLTKTREALGKDWQPKGATSEGDVKQKQHVENTPLSRFWENWNGAIEPALAFRDFDGFMKTRRSP